MKTMLAARVGSIRKRSALASSASASACNDEAIRERREAVPKEPSSHHGQMILPEGEPVVNIVLCISIESVHAVSDADNTVVFEALFREMKEIVWDHTECSLRFEMDDGSTSPLFIFGTLSHVELQMTQALQSSDASSIQHPEQVYVGVLIGKNLPSPIQQRRPSTSAPGTSLRSSISAARKREILKNERPPRQILPRERFGLEFFRLGTITFSCSINGDSRGIKLDMQCLCVFPTPDCTDRSASLFSYEYDQVDRCDVRGNRLEIRFHRSGPKQPTFIAVQSTEAQYIRDAISYLKYNDLFGEQRQVPLRDSTTRRTTRQPSGSLRRRNSLTAFRNEDAVEHHIQSKCKVIGCSEMRCLDPAITLGQQQPRPCSVWFCDLHSSILGKPCSPRSPSKRGLFAREKSVPATEPLVLSKHYTRLLKYHGALQKYGGKYQLTKSWNQKFVALIDSPVGGFLCYYDKLTHCPGMTTETAPRERRVIDLSSIVCIRRESAISGAPKFSFDVVTIYRNWTFAAPTAEEYEVWIFVLSDAVEKQCMKSPDRPLRFPVKSVIDPLNNLPSRYDGSTTLEVSAHGVTVCTGTDGESDVYSWYFTEIQKWSIVEKHSEPCCLLSCLSASPGADAVALYRDFLFQTADAQAICHTIEFFVGRCMAKLESIMVDHPESTLRPPRPSGVCVGGSESTTLTNGNDRTLFQKEKQDQSNSPKITKPFEQVRLESVSLRPIGIPTAEISSTPTNAHCLLSEDQIDVKNEAISFSVSDSTKPNSLTDNSAPSACKLSDARDASIVEDLQASTSLPFNSVSVTPSSVSNESSLGKRVGIVQQHSMDNPSTSTIHSVPVNRCPEAKKMETEGDHGNAQGVVRLMDMNLHLPSVLTCGNRAETIVLDFPQTTEPIELGDVALDIVQSVAPLVSPTHRDSEVDKSNMSSIIELEGMLDQPNDDLTELTACVYPGPMSEEVAVSRYEEVTNEREPQSADGELGDAGCGMDVAEVVCSNEDHREIGLDAKHDSFLTSEESIVKEDKYENVCRAEVCSRGRKSKEQDWVSIESCRSGEITTTPGIALTLAVHSLWPDTLPEDNTRVTDNESDRFESFEYCEGAITIAEVSADTFSNGFNIDDSPCNHDDEDYYQDTESEHKATFDLSSSRQHVHCAHGMDTSDHLDLSIDHCDAIVGEREDLNLLSVNHCDTTIGGAPDLNDAHSGQHVAETYCSSLADDDDACIIVLENNGDEEEESLVVLEDDNAVDLAANDPCEAIDEDDIIDESQPSPADEGV